MSSRELNVKVVNSQLAAILPEGLNDHQREKLGRYLSRRSYNTVKTYLHWLSRWDSWLSEQNGHQHLFPINPLLLHRFINENRVLRHSTLSLCVSALNSLNKRALGMGSILTMDVEDALQRIKDQEVFKKIETGQAIPFMLDDLRKVIKLHAGSPSLRMLRDLNMLWLGFETLLRSAEIRRIQVGDLSYDKANTVCTVTVFRTKGKTQTTLYYDLTPQLSASVRLLLKRTGLSPLNNPKEYLFQAVDQQDRQYMPTGWVKRSRGKDKDELLKQHALLPAIEGVVVSSQQEPTFEETDPEFTDRVTEDPGMLSQDTLLRSFKSLWLSVNPGVSHEDTAGRYQCWTAHSVRVGGAQELFENNVSLPKIMEMGNWTSQEMVLRYVRKSSSKNKAMTNLLADKL